LGVYSAFGNGEGCRDHDDRAEDEQDLIPTALMGQDRQQRGHEASVPLQPEPGCRIE